MTAPAGKDKLAETIARRLDPTATAIAQDRIREQCEECAQQFHGNFDDATASNRRGRHKTDAVDQRARLKAVEKTCEEAAKAIWRAPQEVAWLPVPELIRNLAHFANQIRIAERSGNRAAAALLRRKMLKASGDYQGPEIPEWFDLPGGLTQQSSQLRVLSQAAGQAAKRLPMPDARAIPKEDFFAHWGCRLVHEFCPELAPEVVRNQPELPLEDRTAADYIAANWSRLSPDFRAVHNRLLQVRGLPTIPPPEVDCYVPPTPARRRKFPWKKYLTVTGLLAQYVVGPNSMKFRDACLKVRKRYQS